MTTATYDDMSPSRIVGRVRAASAGSCRLYVELRNGQVVTVDGTTPLNIPVGSVVLVTPDDNHIELAPSEIWPEESWVGVVRLKLPDVTILDSNGKWRMLPTTKRVDCSEGNTVEARDSCGVVRVLSKDPIRYIDLPSVDESVVNKFKTKEKETTETFEDFGGLDDIVARAKELIELPLKKKDALSKIGARPIKGVLFTGPPGTGKTMLARIIANNTDSEFYEISGPEVFSKWYGQSEEVLRELFADAAQQERAIIFFDEIDSVAGQRADQTHEASRRVVAQLLTLMDGFTSDDNVVVIAATNRPQDIDAALRRPGRFDWEILFPLPNSHDRKSILQTSARRLSTTGPLPHVWVSHETEGWSAAELAAIWSEAALLAVADGRSTIMAEDYVGGFERVSVHRHRIEPPLLVSNEL